MTKRLALVFILSALLLPQPGSTQRPGTQRSYALRPVPTQTSREIPVPSGLIVKTSAYKGGDLGARINDADKALGAKTGWIVVDTVGEISTQVRLSVGHKLKFPKGRFPLRNLDNNFAGTIILSDNTAIYGEGVDDTVLIEPSNAFIAIQSVGVTQSENTYYAAGITKKITLAGFTIEGSNTQVEGGVRSTIELGNAHHVHIYRVKLKDTACLGITAGGTGLTGKHAEDWLVENCTFEGVASQNLNVVNGSHITFRFNVFLRPGKLCGGLPCEGVTAIDVEPNSSKDAASFITISDNLIDSSDSPFQHGNGILIQNGVGVPDFGPVSVLRNRVIGGPLRLNYAGNISTGIYLGGATNTTVANNEVIRVAHSGFRAENAHRNTILHNKIVSAGTGGIEAVNFINSSDNRFAFNSVTIDPRSTLANTVVAEMGTSDRNTFEGNIPLEIVLSGKASKIVRR